MHHPITIELCRSTSSNMKKLCMTIIFITSVFQGVLCFDTPCVPRMMEYGYVCVCNSTYCDTVNRPARLARTQYYMYTTGQDSPGFTRTVGSFIDNPPAADNNTVVFTVNSTVRYQEIYGFGGTFTDSTGMVFLKLPKGAQNNFIQSYFSTQGLEHNMARVPIAASDFSPRIYTYDDTSYADINLTQFSLQDEDYLYKIPLIQKALAVSPHSFKLVGCSFTAPAWMKSNDAYPSGYILAKYLTSWAKYHIKFLDAYADNGINFWVFTGGNEVQFPFMISGQFEIGTVGWPLNHRQWLQDHLAPLLRASNHSDVKLALLDDMRPFAKYWMSRVASDSADLDEVIGVALHFYWDWISPVSMLTDFHEAFPDKLILYTEASINTILFGGNPVQLGDWERGGLYAYNIIENLNHFTNAYLDWNLALNTDGGPYIQLPIDGPVIVNETSGEFYKNPMFYALGHFSKFVQPGSVRLQVVQQNSTNTTVSMSSSDKAWFRSKLFSKKFSHVKAADDATTTPASALPTFPSIPTVTVPEAVSCLATVDTNNRTTIVVFNSKNEAVNVTITDVVLGSSISVNMAAQTLSTFVYWPGNS